MQTFDQSLMHLVKQELVTYEEALKHVSNPDDFALRFRGIASTSDGTWDDFEGEEEEADRGREEVPTRRSPTRTTSHRATSSPATASLQAARARARRHACASGSTGSACKRARGAYRRGRSRRGPSAGDLPGGDCRPPSGAIASRRLRLHPTGVSPILQRRAPLRGGDASEIRRARTPATASVRVDRAQHTRGPHSARNASQHSPTAASACADAGSPGLPRESSCIFRDLAVRGEDPPGAVPG